MSSVLRPVGPEPPGVYWRRRAVLVGGLLLVLLLVWFLFLRGGGSGQASPSGSSSPTVAPTNSATTSGPASPTATPTGSSASPTATGVTACKDSAIEVKASTDAASYPAGSTVKMTLTITNVGDVACTRDVGAKANELSITSGGYAVWSSDDCNPGGDSKIVTMKPQDVYAVTVSWDGRVTEGKCRTDGPEAKAGSYDVTGRNGDVKSQPTRFALT